MIDKDVVVPALAAEWAALDELLTALPPADWARPTALPGWSVQDNVAHLIGTECALAGQAPPAGDGTDVHALPHVRNDIGAANELWVRGLRGESPARVLDRFREITAIRHKALDAMTQADFDRPSWTPAGRDTYGRFMRIRVFDCWMHEQDIREAVGVPGHEDGPCAELSLTEMTGALGYIIGKKAGAPEGVGVTIELTGPLTGTWHVAVAGRAAVVDELPGPATTTLRLPSTLFTRLAGGRGPVADRLPDVTIEGDTDLGTRIAHALPFTI
ncbi:MAG TPA: maleylpyruvate isomerase family mycothiol-dependent enzyme [Actinophytocola sp.]|nr:maleylpyruvate isomerase family mycothiol-dependent enzyme [Actinophytocola sp.]